MRNRPSSRNQTGLSLIEVLVSLVIFAFGLLGAAGLQIATLKSNQFAATSATAVALAREYGEMMQSFPSAVITTNEGTSSFFIDTNAAFASPNPGACRGTAVTCTTAQVAQSMLEDWRARVQQSLPGGRAEVCRDSEPRNADGDLEWGIATCDDIGDIVVIKIGWLARNDKGENLNANLAGTDLSTDRPRLVFPVMGNLRDFAAP